METEARDYAQSEVHDDDPRVDPPDVDARDDEHTRSAGMADADQDIDYTKPATEPETIQLNLSPLIALVFGLGLGFLAGFVGRPYLLSRSQPLAALPQSSSTQAPAVSTPASAAQAPATPAPAGAAAAEPTPVPAGTSADEAAAREAAAQTLMTLLSAQTRHFKGDPNAPVTMIEFSDFQ